MHPEWLKKPAEVSPTGLIPVLAPDAGLPGAQPDRMELADGIIREEGAALKTGRKKQSRVSTALRCCIISGVQRDAQTAKSLVLVSRG